jgi:hypothetical protein
VVTAAGSVVDVYRLDRDRLQDELCRLADDRELTDDELDAFLPDDGGARDKARCR